MIESLSRVNSLSALIGNRNHLKWIAPPAFGKGGCFHQRIYALQTLLETGLLEKVYSIENERKNVYKGSCEELGAVAVKEVRWNDPWKRFRRLYIKKGAALHELRIGAQFHARGGNTPAFFGAALDRTLLGLKRVFFFTEWIEDSVTLADYIIKNRDHIDIAFWKSLALDMVSGAQKGLVHNGHSPFNILVKEEGQTIRFYTIDFAHSRLYGKINYDGLIKDAVRIMRRLMRENICDYDQILILIDQLVETGWDPPLRKTALTRFINGLESV